MSQTSEFVGRNIVKIVDNKGSFYGSGFCIEIQQEKYYITCHHCICKLNEVFIERDGDKCGVEWIEQFSDMSKDIAVLKADNCGDVKAIMYAKEAMPKLGVIV